MKPMVRLYPVDIDRLAWSEVDALITGAQVKHLTEDRESGALTRIVRFDSRSGGEVLPHAYTEEVYVLSGSCKRGDRFYPAGSYMLWQSIDEVQAVETTEGCTWLQTLDVRKAEQEKLPVELYQIDIARMTWEAPSGAPEGVSQKVLASSERGSITRLLRVTPGTDTAVFNHDHSEEVWILEGSYKMEDEFHPAGTYTCKGPGVAHGPFWTDEGYVCLEVRNYE